MSTNSIAELTLNDLKTGEWGIIKKILAKGSFRKRLIEMGFTENTPIFVEKFAPLKDPVEYIIRGYHISLRHSEAKLIQVIRQKHPNVMLESTELQES